MYFIAVQYATGTSPALVEVRDYTGRMGFYYGPGKEPERDEGGGFKEVLLVTWIVFRALALPLGLIFGGIAGLVLLFFLFTWQPLLGVGLLVLLVAAVVARGVWEARHPPELK
ncbi:MAG: hypothetical protein IT429_09410 [Gemmataceae bacterium]|nr:hypothetical protein [Gemmataceae bacterium]